MTERPSHDPADDIDRMLTASAPRTSTVTPAVEDELARMSALAGTDTTPVGGRRLAPRIAAVGIAGAIVLGGAGAAAAATGGLFTSWWADEPDAVYTYTLPSGAQCESRWGNITAGTKDEPIAEAARQWYAQADIAALVDAGIDEQIRAQRADKDRWHVLDDGTQLPAWYGTDLYATPDLEYSNAVGQVLQNALDDELERQGLDLGFEHGDWGLRISGETSCPGAQW